MSSPANNNTKTSFATTANDAATIIFLRLESVVVAVIGQVKQYVFLRACASREGRGRFEGGRKKFFPQTDRNISFEVVGSIFEYKIGQKIGMAVYRNYGFDFTSDDI